MSGIIRPGQGPLHALLQSKLDPLAVQLGAQGVGVILIGAVPLQAVAHCAFATPPQNLADDLRRIADFYRDAADRMQRDAITQRLKGKH